jgi:hypothetical protein
MVNPQQKKDSLIKVTYFRAGYKNGLETNWRIGKFSLRIATRQIAFWINYNPVLNLLF